MVGLFSFLATVLSLWGQWLVGNKSKLTFPVWTLSNVLWIIVNFIGPTNYYQVAMFVVYIAMNIVAWYKWMHRSSTEGSEKGPERQ